MYLEPHDYRIYYVNIGLPHQYGISATESQMFLRAKRPQRRRARRNGCFHRLVTLKRKVKTLLMDRAFSTTLGRNITSNNDPGATDGAQLTALQPI